MGKGTQKPTPSDQEEALNICNGGKKEYKWASNIKKSDWERFCSSRVCILVCVVLLVLLIIALVVVSLRTHSPPLEFSYVCPDAWLGFQGKCYYFSDAEKNWTASQESCEALGASLAFISSMDEMNFVKRYKGKANHWFGLRKEKDNNWWWTNGTVFNNWFEVRGGGLCAYLNEERISSSLCHTKKNWLCSRPDNYVLWKQKAHP